MRSWTRRSSSTGFRKQPLPDQSARAGLTSPTFQEPNGRLQRQNTMNKLTDNLINPPTASRQSQKGQGHG